MSPNVLSLERCRLLAEVYPNAKTEYAWVKISELDEHWVIYSKDNILNPSWITAPAWQIHELLSLFKDQMTIVCRVIDYEVFILGERCDTRTGSIIDVSLVEALGKLALFVKKLEERK